MTVRELSQLYWLDREIKYDTERLKTLRSEAESLRSPKFDDMPRGGGTNGTTENLIAEIVDLDAAITAKKIQIIQEKRRLERYIAQIDDSLTRQIFELRFAECMQWAEIAEAVHMSIDGVKKRCYRYLDAEDKKREEI